MSNLACPQPWGLSTATWGLNTITTGAQHSHMGAQHSHMGAQYYHNMGSTQVAIAPQICFQLDCSRHSIHGCPSLPAVPLCLHRCQTRRIPGSLKYWLVEMDSPIMLAARCTPLQPLQLSPHQPGFLAISLQSKPCPEPQMETGRDSLQSSDSGTSCRVEMDSPFMLAARCTPLWPLQPSPPQPGFLAISLQSKPRPEQ